LTTLIESSTMLSLFASSPAVRLSSPVMQVGAFGTGIAPINQGSFGGRVALSRDRNFDPARGSDGATILVQGGSLRTWTYRSPSVEQVQVVLLTEGRPLDADIELWHGPDNTPCKMRVYVENGQLRPFSAVIEAPRGPNTIAIRNIGQVEFPISAVVIADNVDIPTPDCAASATTIQGGALRTYPFDPRVDSVQVLLKTDGRPLNSRIELLQGVLSGPCQSSMSASSGRPSVLRTTCTCSTACERYDQVRRDPPCTRMVESAALGPLVGSTPPLVAGEVPIGALVICIITGLTRRAGAPARSIRYIMVSRRKGGR